MTYILGIESSCDETAAAIVDDTGRVHAQALHSQQALHQPYGGVVPEIAARDHLAHIDGLVQQVWQESGLGPEDIDGFAATGGPGLIGGVIVGVMAAKTLASVHRKPFIAVNHLEGHALTVRLTDRVAFPFVLLLVSGGHCQLLQVRGVGAYCLLGQTRDDALGEAFDKTAKMLGLPYPGGPQIERHAVSGNSERFAFPRPLLQQPGCDMSFSGLKTAVRHAIADIPKDADGSVPPQDCADICASFQAAAADVLDNRVSYALREVSTATDEPLQLVVAGGVAANQYIRARLHACAMRHGATLYTPPPALCTDNAAMIAWAGMEKFRLGQSDSLDFEPKARWPLTHLRDRSG